MTTETTKTTKTIIGYGAIEASESGELLAPLAILNGDDERAISADDARAFLKAASGSDAYSKIVGIVPSDWLRPRDRAALVSLRRIANATVAKSKHLKSDGVKVNADSIGFGHGISLYIDDRNADGSASSVRTSGLDGKDSVYQTENFNARRFASRIDEKIENHAASVARAEEEKNARRAHLKMFRAALPENLTVTKEHDYSETRFVAKLANNTITVRFDVGGYRGTTNEIEFRASFGKTEIKTTLPITREAVAAAISMTVSAAALLSLAAPKPAAPAAPATLKSVA